MYRKGICEYPRKICGCGYGYGCKISYPRQAYDLRAVIVLFYTKSVGVVTSVRVTKMVTPFDLPWPKTFDICKLHGSIFYRTGVIAN